MVEPPEHNGGQATAKGVPLWGLGIGVPVFVVLAIARHFGFVERAPLALILVELLVGLGAMALFTARFPPGTQKARPRLLLLLQMLLVGVIIYTLGWGSVLAVGFVFPASNIISADGSEVGPWAIAWIVVTVAAGELAVGLGIVKSMVPGAVGHGLALLEITGTCAAVWIITRHQQAKERAERSLSESAQRFAALVQHASDMIVVVGPDNTITYASPAFETNLGYLKTRWQGMDARRLLSAEDVEALRTNGTGGAPRHLELRIRHADRTWRWCEVIFSDLVEVPGVNGWVANIRDITERKLAAEELREAHERFRSAFENAPIGMGMCDLEGRIIQVNAAYGRILGRPPEELVGVFINDLTHPDDRHSTSEAMRRFVHGEGESFELEKRYLHSDGYDVWVSLKVSAVRDSSDKPLYLIGQAEDITERRALRDRLAHDAVHDPLTGLPNRLLFMDRLELALRRAQRGGQLVTVMFLDLDHFKLVNDSLGHDAGDQLLEVVAAQLAAGLRTSDTLARFGGDEFTALCEVNNRDEALEVANRLLATMSKPVNLDGNDYYLSVSIGVAVSESGHEPSSVLLRNADVAMYLAKEAGPGHIRFHHSESEAGTVYQLRTSNELHRALERDELELHYQPLVDLHTDSLVGLEALVRWQHPNRGLLLPGEFIALAEHSGFIIPLGTWVLQEACRQAAVWNSRRTQAGQEAGRLNMSVNVSARQLSDPGFPDVVAQALSDSGLEADQLWLEITETTVMRQDPGTTTILRSLKDLGIHLAIDDFGTGYSSLIYLKQIPVETLKVDRGFVDEIDYSSDDVAIVRAIIALGETLGLSVIAEGVERDSQAEKLRDLDCFLAQGYLYGRPQPARLLDPYPTDDLTGWAAAPVSTPA
ncbi:MAG TPA: EAL domain-containing protein [Acidimicrobiales bacterium]|nr:EAL domain-containing protein [Acidimicrobiales bacterium]